MTQSMDDGNGADLPRLSNEYPNLFEFLQRHRLVSFVYKMQCALPLRIIPNDAFKDADCPVLGTKHLTRNILGIDSIACDLIELARAADRQNSRFDVSAADRWKDGKLVPVVDVRILINIFLINCRQNNRPVVLYSRIIALKMSQDITDGYARLYLELHLPRT